MDNTVNVGFCFGPRPGLRCKLKYGAKLGNFILRFFLFFLGGELMRKEVKIGGKIKAADYFMSITFSLALIFFYKKLFYKKVSLKYTEKLRNP